MNEPKPDFVKLQELKCPTCGYKMTGAMALDAGRKPEIGDIGVCVNCGDVLEFDSAMHIQVASLKSLMILTEKQRHEIGIAQQTIRKLERKQP